MKHASLQELKPTILDPQSSRVCSAGLPGFPKPHQFSTEDITAYQVARPKPRLPTPQHSSLVILNIPDAATL